MKYLINVRKVQQMQCLAGAVIFQYLGFCGKKQNLALMAPWHRSFWGQCGPSENLMDKLHVCPGTHTT